MNPTRHCAKPNPGCRRLPKKFRNDQVNRPIMNDLNHSSLDAAAASLGGDDACFQVIADLEALRRLKPEWDSLLAQDPDAGIFLSHDWLAPAFAAHPGRWRVFALRDGAAALLCILPVKYRVHWSQSQGAFTTEIEAGGRLAWGEYTGFICRAGHEETALAAMALHLRALPWKTLSLRYEPTRRRCDLFAAALGDGFQHRYRSYRINSGTTDNLVSPQVPLTDDFETLMAERLSANTRQKIRRFRRKLLGSGEYRLQVSTPGTVERDIAQLLVNWVAKWSDKHGEAKAVQIAERYGRALLTAEAMGALYLPTLWQGDRMLGALGHVIDDRRKIAHFLVAGRDPAASDPAIGLLLHAEALEWSVGAGLRIYDFGHGDESYKFSFGPDPERSHYLSVRRAEDTNVLDAICLKPALQRLAEFAAAGRTESVEKGATQLARMV